MQYLKNIKEELAQINAIVEKARSTGQLPSIERDILLAKLAHIYEEILLGEAITTSDATQRASKPEVTVEKKLPQQDLANQHKPESTSAMPAGEPVKATPEPMNAPPKIDMEAPKNPVSHKSTREDDSIILAEKYQGKRKFRNEVIAEHHQRTDMQSKLQNKPITDLSKAIGVNDKFLFIKELFGGDADRYHQTIQQLNGMADLNEAIIYLQENFDWDADNEVALAFIDLVRRKHF